MHAPRGRARWLQKTRKMRFEQAYTDWQTGRLTREEAARILGVCERSFRRYAQRYETGGLEGGAGGQAAGPDLPAARSSR
jgi:hypothetical protein